MNLTYWQRLKRAPRLLAMPVSEPLEQASRILSVQRNILLPARCMLVIVVFYYLFYAHLADLRPTEHGVVLQMLQRYFIVYIIFNAFAAILLVLRRFPPALVQWIAFAVGLLDGLLLAGLTVETGGFESTLFWVFPGLIILNALSIPLAAPQIVLNVALSGFYLGAGLLYVSVSDSDLQTSPLASGKSASASFSVFAVRDLPSFIRKLDARNDPVSNFLWSQFSEAVRGEIAADRQTNGASKTLQSDLVDELNRIIRGPPVYDPQRSAGVALSEEVKAQAARKVTGDKLTRLNQELLEDAYPSDLTKRSRSKFMGNKPAESTGAPEVGSEPFGLQLIILWMLTASCYGVQLLSFRDRQAEQEAREAAARNSELKAAGRLAAEIAHQLKNPLGIINNAVFSLQRGLRGSKQDFSEQIGIIREEVERSGPDHHATHGVCAIKRGPRGETERFGGAGPGVGGGVPARRELRHENPAGIPPQSARPGDAAQPSVRRFCELDSKRPRSGERRGQHSCERPSAGREHRGSHRGGRRPRDSPGQAGQNL